ITKAGDRLWAIDSEDRKRIWFSKPFVAEYGIEWNTACTLFMADEAVGISDYNGIPAVFGKTAIWIIDGNGPNANGVGEFNPPQRLPYDIETIYHGSVCKTPFGIAFRSR